MVDNFRVKTAMPHLQVSSGDRVAFLQFTSVPPDSVRQWLLPAIKDTTAANRYRAGPPGFGRGWHIRDPDVVAQRVEKHWPGLSHTLREIHRAIEKHPERVSDHREPQPRQRPSSASARGSREPRGPGGKASRLTVVKEK